MRALAIVALLVACGERSVPSVPPPPPKVAAAAADAAPAIPADAAAPPPDAVVRPGYDFIADVEVLYRVAACGHLDRPLPEAITHGDPARAAKLDAVVAKHCAELKPHADTYRRDYFGAARAWFVAHQPADLPTTVVYAFGGGDLVSALVAFPKATEITTMSLELAGDPRKIEALEPGALSTSLAAFRREIGALIWVGSNLSVNLSAAQQSAIASQLSSHLIGLAVGGYEPVSARFFRIEDDGSLHYFEKAEIDADVAGGKSLSGSWRNPAFAASFFNVEIEYRPIGGATTDVRTFRHIGWNLGDPYLKDHPQVLRHLEAKGKVAVCVKGASYLLWFDEFSLMRTYLVDHLAWMVADSTGLAPIYLANTDLVQEAYGHFEGPVLAKMVGTRGDVSARALWAKPAGPMPFRFGYLDLKDNKHVSITHPRPKQQP